MVQRLTLMWVRKTDYERAHLLGRTWCINMGLELSRRSGIDLCITLELRRDGCGAKVTHVELVQLGSNSKIARLGGVIAVSESLNNRVHNSMLMGVEVGAKLVGIHLACLSVRLIEDFPLVDSERGWFTVRQKLRKGTLRDGIVADGQSEVSAVTQLA